MNLNSDNTKVTSGRDGSYKPGEVKGRPSSSDSKKDFKKVLEKEDEPDQNQQATNEILEESDGIALAMAEGTKKKIPSPFDLSGKTPAPFFGKSQKSAVPLTNHVPTNRLQSPAELYVKLETGEKPSTIKTIDDSTMVDVNLAMLDDKNKFTTRFSTEQNDLSYINPLAAVTTPQQPNVNLNLTTEKPVIPTSHIQDIINQMVEKVEQIKTTGSTETVVTLKHPPIFEGARIVVTDFDSAKKEFNITIENLTQQAKNLVDMQANKDNLISSLHAKGYAVHIFATTTTTETRVVDALPQNEQGKPRGDEEPREGRQQGKNRQNQA
jgi:hypothetical protein